MYIVPLFTLHLCLTLSEVRPFVDVGTLHICTKLHLNSSEQLFLACYIVCLTNGDKNNLGMSYKMLL